MSFFNLCVFKLQSWKKKSTDTSISVFCIQQYVICLLRYPINHFYWERFDTDTGNQNSSSSTFLFVFSTVDAVRGHVGLFVPYQTCFFSGDLPDSELNGRLLWFFRVKGWKFPVTSLTQMQHKSN